MGKTIMRSLLISTLLILVYASAYADDARNSAGSGAGEIDNSSPGQLSGADEAYDVKLKSLEEKVNQLKEKIFRSKTRLMLLQETLMHGVIAGSKIVLAHQNEMKGPFKLESVAYYLDGAPIFGKIDIDGDLDKRKEIEIYNGSLAPGNHLVSVYMVYRGQSGLFSYVEGIKVKLKSNYSFRAEEGKITRIDVIGYDKGGVTSKFEERPAVKYKTSLKDLTDEDVEDIQKPKEQG